MVQSLSLSLVSMLMPRPSSGFDFSTLYSGSANGGAPVNVGTIANALSQADKNEPKQLAQMAQSPEVQRDLARYERVLSEAKTFEEVLDDPVARTVLMKAYGLGDQVNYIGLAKRALMSDPNDPNSVANKLASVNTAWLDFAKAFNIPKNGLDALYPQQDGFAAKWRVSIERAGKTEDVYLEITKVRSRYEAKVDGVAVPVTIEKGVMSVNYLWRDAKDDVVFTSLQGKIDRNGVTLSGSQSHNGVAASKPWTAELFNAGAVKEVSDNYVAEKRLDMLDQQMPGLGSAVLFKRVAATLDTPMKILGNAFGREVVTTAFGIPKQIALQSLQAQEKALLQRMDPAKLKNAAFAEAVAQRYLIQLNGGFSGVTI